MSFVFMYSLPKDFRKEDLSMVIPFAEELLDEPLILKDRKGASNRFNYYNTHLILGDTMYLVFYGDDRNEHLSNRQYFLMKMSRDAKGLLRSMQWVVDPEEVEKAKQLFINDKFIAEKQPILLNFSEFTEFSIGRG